MIQLSEMFNYIGINGCCDVATSLAQNEIDVDLSIPIYDIAYLKILSGKKSGFICNAIPEYSLVRKLAHDCGAVTIALNLLDIDVLTLLGGVCIYTPRTGANIFIKNNTPDLMHTVDAIIVEQLADLVGMPIDRNCLQDSAYILRLAVDIVDKLFNMLMAHLENDLSNSRIKIQRWEYLVTYYNMLRQSGEIQEMQRYRIMNRCVIC